MSPLALLASERRDLKLPQARLAHAAGISVPTLRGLERGSGSVRSLVRVMDVLGLRWGWVEAGDNPAVNLAARRRARMMTQAQLARRVGCSRATIVSLERHLAGNVSVLLAVLHELGVRPALMPSGRRMKGALVPYKNSPSSDVVLTPPELAARIIGHFSERMTGRVLDPARGTGAFYDNFPNHLERHWCEIRDGKDFLRWTQPVDWIVSNPPWSRLREFTRHAMTLASDIVWLAPMTNLVTKARLRDLEEHGFGIAELLMIERPKNWPHSGFQLVAAHLRRSCREPWKVGRLASSNPHGSDLGD